MASMRRALEGCAPDEIYNLAAQSSVGVSWKEPLETGEVTGLGAARLMQAAREVCPQSKFFQASSSEMLGRAASGIVDEKTPLCPDNPYGAAKTYAHHLARNFRESFDMPISCGILFNHESPLRSEQFVTRKITLAVARIRHGLQDSLGMGNMDVVRDWGFAGDFVRAMWLMLQNEPDDFILATGQPRPLRDFVTQAFCCAGLNSEDYVFVDPTFFRPSETTPIIGDARKSSTRLGWTPQVSFEQTVQLMVEADLNRVTQMPAAVRYFVE
jgi:GDPmannose 4,6-dehydratase